MSIEVDVVVVGGGQAGLAMSYELTQSNIDHVVIEKEMQVASSWRKRYESLKLITPNWMNSLPGFEISGVNSEFANRNEVIDYLEKYAEYIKPPLYLGCEVLSVNKSDDIYFVKTDCNDYITKNIVVATGPFQKAKIPDIARNLNESVYQVHSSEYYSPEQIPGNDVLVVGSGNSGVYIADELAKSKNVSIAIERDFTIPRRLSGQQFLNIVAKLGVDDLVISEKDLDQEEDLMWWMDYTGLYERTVESSFGQMLSKNSDPYVGDSVLSKAEKNNITVVDKIIGCEGDTVVTEDDKKMHVDSIIWSTGYQYDYSWLNLDVTDENGAPIQNCGESDIPGLYFLGLRWMCRADSGLLRGVGRDANRIADRILKRTEQVEVKRSSAF